MACQTVPSAQGVYQGWPHNYCLILTLPWGRHILTAEMAPIKQLCEKVLANSVTGAVSELGECVIARP